jgi:hypothetical protein
MIQRGRLLEFVSDNLQDLLVYCEAMGPWSGADDRGYVEDPPEARAGHDLWLDRRGHGSGFWSRDLGELGDRLYDVASRMGEPDDHTPYDCGDDEHADV